MRLSRSLRTISVLSILAAVSFAATAHPASPTSQNSGTSKGIRERLERVDTLMRLGVAEKGASRAFREATELLDEAEAHLTEVDLPPADEENLRLELAAVREDLEDLVELYADRFYGVFPLARVVVPSLLADEGLLISEQLFQNPEVAAVMVASRKVANLLAKYDHPHVVFRSSPSSRRLENVASEELLRDGRSHPHNRKTLISALGAADLAAFDRGDLEPRLIDRLATALDTVSLLVLTIGQPAELGDAYVRTIHGDYFQPGLVIQGSPIDAPLFVRVETFDFVGYGRDRREQYPLAVVVQLLLLASALLWSARVKWRVDRPFSVFGRLVIGAALFGFGGAFASAAIVVLNRFMPEASALAAAALWWPALLGLLVILGGGLIAWIGQARLTDIVPGTRGARAVGTIFALAAMGGSSRFVTPLMILDPDTGWASLFPFLFAALSLALLFAFAARTGPPVPHYFTIGPLLLAPLVGLALMTASPSRLWQAAAMSAVLCLAAWIRHRIAVARGTEEPEPTQDEAAALDKKGLMKLQERIPKKL